VAVNSTYNQDDMSAKAKALFSYSGLPGISDECRSTGTLLNCGTYFQQCATIPFTNGKSSNAVVNNILQLLSIFLLVDQYVKRLTLPVEVYCLQI
jgi:hypothetical protein